LANSFFGWTVPLIVITVRLISSLNLVPAHMDFAKVIMSTMLH